MKKIFTMFFALLAFAFCAKAQVTFVNESFDGSSLPGGWTVIDADGDGYNWMPSLQVSTSFYTHSGEGCITSASYVNNVGALTPDNWLITPQITVSAGDSVTFWYRGQDPSYAAENFGVYVSTTGTATSNFTSIYQGTADSVYQQVALSLAAYVGQNIYVAIRHYNITDMYWLNIDDIKIGSLPTTPTINEPAAINFGQVAMSTTSTQSLAVTAYSLTNDITVTTAAPFAVSADGTTFGTTATLTATTGAGNITNATLYVQYSPTTVGTDNGTLTLASTGATSVTANLIGESISCTVSSFPYNFEFDNDGMANCWDIIDANNDASTFTISTGSGYAYYTYNTSNPADDWLVSPIFDLTGGEMASFDYWCSSASWPERFMVYALGTDTVLLVDTVNVTNGSSAPITQYLTLSSLTGNYRIGIHCISDANQFRLYVDNFSVFATGTANLTVNPESIDFGILPTGTTANSTVDLTILNATDNITVTTAAPFSVSLDNNTFATSVTIPTPSASVANQTIYVAYNPTTAGAQNGMLVISTTGAADTVTLAGAGVDCDVITTFPFTETFLATSTTAPCWQIVDHNNDGKTFIMNTEAGQVVYQYSSTNNADEYLISPEMTLTSGLYGHVDYACASSSYPEKFSIYVIPQNGTIENAVNIVPTVTVTNTSFETQNFALAAYANQTIRIAIKAESDADMYLLGFANFVIEEVPAASLTVDPTSMTFSAIAGSPSAAQAANVTAYSLTSNITVSTTAPFEVSTNGTSFNTTATIPAGDFVNQVLYVRYNTSAAGTNNGTVTLTSGSLSATINVSGSAMDCSQPQALPFVENFDGVMPTCWTILDVDGDGYSWEHSSDPVSYFPAGVDLSGSGNNGSNGFILSGSFSNVTGEALTPDNWLISPTLAIPSQGGKLTFYVAAQDAGYAEEHYGVYVSTTGTNPNDFTLLYEETIDENGGPRDQGIWKQKSANLPYPGQNIHVAIRHFNCTDMFLLNLDDFTVTVGTGVEEHGLKTVIYPNPANNVLNINSTSNINRVEVYNMMGQMVGMYEANDVNTQINTTSFANGVYMVKINTENGTSTKKFTVAR
ncbi:MAG: choice-of-anchor J domain-containing protein [Bacteroidales bacterium]|nr:choice-of-anchor J domain-containing protein [Bacteroidales bacterium]